MHRLVNITIFFDGKDDWTGNVVVVSDKHGQSTHKVHNVKEATDVFNQALFKEAKTVLDMSWELTPIMLRKQAD